MNRMSLPRALGRILAEYALVFPLAYLLTGVLDAPMTWIFLLLLPAGALIGALVRRVISAGIVELILGMALSVAVTAVVCARFGLRINPANFVVPILVAPFTAFRGRQLVQHDWHAVLPGFFPCLILVLDLIFMAFMNYTDQFAPYVPVLLIAGPIALISGYYTMNTISRRNLADDQRLEQAGDTTQRTAVPRNLAPQNRALVTGLLAVGAVLSFLPFLVTAAKFLLRVLGKILAFLLNMMLSLVRQRPERVQGATDELPPPEAMEYVYTDFWDAFFRVLAGVLFAAVMITILVLAIIALRKGWRFLKELLRKLAADRGAIGADSLDFDDVSDSLLNLRDLPKKYWEDLKNRVSELSRRSVRWNELEDERERVKYLYRSALRRAKKAGYTHHESYTANEALSSASRAMRQLESVEPELREQYNAVRYGEKEPTPGEAEALKNRAGL